MIEHNIRNLKYNGVGGIDFEWDHQLDGWVPSCAHPDDPDPVGKELWALASKQKGIGKYVPPPPLTLEQQRAQMRPLDRLQFRTRLKAAGINTAAIEDAIATIADDDKREDMEIFWESAQSFPRLHAFVALVMKSMKAEEIDAIWQAADGL